MVQRSTNIIILNKVVGNGISLSKQMFILSPSLQLIEHCLGRCDHFSDVYCNVPIQINDRLLFIIQ
jgi:hypothetical protein